MAAVYETVCGASVNVMRAYTAAVKFYHKSSEKDKYNREFIVYTADISLNKDVHFINEADQSYDQDRLRVNVAKALMYGISTACRLGN